MDRASDYGSEGWGFESLRGHLKKRVTMKVVTLLLLQQVLQKLKEDLKAAQKRINNLVVNN
jgi:hypothetical protein